MKLFIFFSLLLVSLNTFSQDTIYLNKNWKEISNPSEATYYEVTTQDPYNQKGVTVRTYSPSHEIKRQLSYLSEEKKILHGTMKAWFDNGQLHEERSFKEGKLDGPLFTFWENGQMKRKDNYQNGEPVEGTCWNVEGAEVEYYPLEVKPEFPGGKKGLVKYLKSNMRKSKSGETGKVLVKFKINTKGEVEDIVLEEKAALPLNLEAFRLVNEMPNWQPGLQDGEPVNVIYRLPITFR